MPVSDPRRVLEQAVEAHAEIGGQDFLARRSGETVVTALGVGKASLEVTDAAIVLDAVHAERVRRQPEPEEHGAGNPPWNAMLCTVITDGWRVP